MTARINDSASDRIFNCINLTIITVFLISFLYPLIYIVSASFSSPEAIGTGKVWLWPVDPTIEGYKAVLRHKGILLGFYNSFWYMFVGTTFNIVFTILAAYPLSRKDLFGRDFFMFLFAFTMLFSGGLIPTYLLVKDIGILYTRWALIFPGIIGVYNVIITRTYFQSNIPYELLESAKIDGCRDFRFLMQIVIPLSKPIIAVITLFYAISHWNQFFQAIVYLNDKNLYPLQVILREILILNSIDMDMMTQEEMAARQALVDVLKYSLIVVANIPVLIMYPFVQKHFVKGIMIGALKG